MTTLFSKIIAREIPAVFLYEDEQCVVVLDKFPGIMGQSLVIPRKEVGYIFDIDSKLYRHVFDIAKKIAKATDAALRVDRTCLVVEGFEIPHVHIKLYPMPKGNTDLSRVLRETTEASDDELARVAALIIKKL
ncbi:MAG: HIT family protein [Candidatus Paceibacterota bacterium]